MKLSSMTAVAWGVLGIAGTTHSQIPFDPRPIPWRTDMDAARRVARDLKRPLLVVFR